MKDILTILTESIGKKISENINDNIIEKLHIGQDSNFDDIDFKQFMKNLNKEDTALYNKVQEYMKKSKSLKNNKRKPSTSSSSSNYNYSCGSGRSRSSCGSDTNWGSNCGSSRSSRSYC